MFLLSCRDSPGGKTAGARKTPSWAQSTQVQIIAKEKEDVKIFLSLFHKYFSVILCVFTEGSDLFPGMLPGEAEYLFGPELWAAVFPCAAGARHGIITG